MLLVLGGCGYSSHSECLVKEMQECDSGTCGLAARDYCNSEFPGKTRRYITEETRSTAGMYVREGKTYLFLYEGVGPQRLNFCVEREGKKACSGEKLISYKSKSYAFRSTQNDMFYKFINDAGDGFKEGTKETVLRKVSVGFFRYYFGWTIYILYLFGVLYLLFIIVAIGQTVINWFSGNEDEEEELDESEEDLDEGHEYSDEDYEELASLLISGGEAQTAELESMTKAEIKIWADVFEFNVPSSLSKAEMIERFIEEMDEYVESLEE